MKNAPVTMTLLLAFSIAAPGHAQSGQSKSELFREYFSVTTPLFKAHIPAKTCRTLIAQADSIVSAGSLKTVESKDLQVGSDNLRVCATSDSLARMERDLAVGLHAEFVSELERHEREMKESSQLTPTRQTMKNFPPECDALLRPDLENNGMEEYYKQVDSWRHAIETDDGPTFHKLLPVVAKRVFKGDDIAACGDAAAERQSWEGQLVAFNALLYNAKWAWAMMLFDEKQRKGTVDKYNELQHKYTQLYENLLIVSSAPPRSVYAPLPPITCTSTRIGDTVFTDCN